MQGMTERTQRAGRSGWGRLFALLLACGLLAACGGTALYTNLDEQQANELMAALLDANIGADKSQVTTQQGVGWEIKVSQGDFPRAMQVLEAHRLPRQRYVSMCETFKKEGFASSQIEERARYQCSLEQGLAHTLSGIPGVAEARVHIALPERDPLGNETNDSSAAVTIYQLPGADVRGSETDIKATVKDSVEGLSDLNKVTVKFYTLGSPQAARATPGRMSAAGISPVTIAIGAGVLVLIALVFAILGRLRARASQQAAATQAANGRVWNG